MTKVVKGMRGWNSMRTYYYQIDGDDGVYKIVSSRANLDFVKKQLPDNTIVLYVEPTKGNFEVLWQKEPA